MKLNMFIVFLIIFSVAADKNLLKIEIFWPRSWVAGQVELSSNQETFSTDLNLYVGASESIEGYLAFVRIPQVPWSFRCLIDSWGIDYKVVCKDLVLSKGTYGPVELTVRNSEDGLVLARSINVGNFAVVEELVSDYDGLRIQYQSEERTVGDPCSLTFNFTLNQVMHKFDYFVISLNQQFLYEPGNLTWENDFNGSNFFISTDWNYQETEKKIFIYGNPDDIDMTLNIGFTLTGFFIPESVKNEFLWILEVKKFGANTIIQRCLGFGPSSKIEPGYFSSVSWNFIHPQLNSSIDTVEGLSTFTLLQIESNHSIPINGKIKIEYSNAFICKYTYTNDGPQMLKQSSGEYKDCGLVYNTTDSESSLQCEVSSNTLLTCNVLSSPLTPGSIISIYNFITFYGDAKVLNITTFDDQENFIDVLKESLKFTVGYNDVAQVSNLGFIFSESNSTSVNQAGEFGDFGFFVEFYNDRELQVGENFTIYFPVQKGNSPQEQVACLGENFYGKYVVDNEGNTFESMPAEYWRNSTKLTVFQGNITVLFEEIIPAESIFMFYLGARNKEGTTSSMYLPLFPTFLEDMSQVVFKIKTEEIQLIYSSPFFVDFNSLETRFVPFCNNTFYKGLPIQVFVMLGFYLKSYSSQFYVLFEFNQLETGLEVGSFLPSSPSGAVLFDSKTIKYEFQSFKQDVEQSFFIPFNGMKNDSLSMSASLYVLTPLGRSYKVAYGEYKVNYTDVENMTATDLDIVSDRKPQQVVEMNFEIDGITQDVYRIALFGSPGFQVTSLTQVKQIDYFYDKNLNFPSVFAIDNTSKSSEIYQVQIITPWFVNSKDFFIYFAYAAGENFNNTNCDLLLSRRVDISSALPLVLENYFPDASQAFTFSNEYFDLFFIFRFEGVIREKSYFKVIKGDLDLSNVEFSDWQVTNENVTFSSDDFFNWKSSLTSSEIKNWFKLKIFKVKLPVLHNPHNLTIFSKVQVFDELSRPCYEWSQSENEAVIQFSSGNTESFSSHIKKISVYPDVVGSSLVHLHLTFELSKDLPSNTSIFIKFNFLEDNLPADHLWTSFLFSSASLKPPVLSLTTGERLSAGTSASLRKDFAFNLTDNHPTTVSLWAIKDDFYFIFDDFQATAGQFFIANRQVKPRLTWHQSALDQSTSGHESFHYFHLKIDVEIEKDWTFDFDFSRNYESNVGKFVIFEHLPGTRYLPGTWDGEPINCPVSNWLVSCKVPWKIEAGAMISVGLSVLNPGKAGRVGLYVKNSTNHVAVSPFNWFEFIFSSIPESIIFIKSVSQEAENEENSMHSLVIEAYFDGIVRPGQFFEIILPKQYILKVNNRDQVGCSLTYEGNSSFLYKKLCETEENSIKLFFDSETQFLNTYSTVFTITGLVSPVEGLVRDPQPFEIKRFQIWTNNFQLLLKEPQSVLAMSFGNLNAAYTGFNLTRFQRLLVNEGKKVKLVAGVTMCNFSLRVQGKMMAKDIEVNATVDCEDIFFSDRGRFRISLSEPETRFCISVNESVSEGVYYIYWRIYENPLVADNYLPPLPTEVLVKNDKVFDVLVDSNFEVPDHRFSQPVKVEILPHNELLVSPFDQIMVKLNSESEVSLEFTPNPVILSNFESKAWFSLKCSNCSLDQTHIIQVELSGINSSKFKLKSKTSFKVISQPLTQSNSVLHFSFINPSALSISVISDSPGIAYWALISSDLLSKSINLITQDSIIQNSFNFINSSKSSQSLSNQINFYKSTLDDTLSEILLKGQNYQVFIQEAKILSKQVYFTAISPISSGVTNISIIPNLMPGSEFYLRIYIDNYSNNPMTVLSSYLSSSSDLPPGELFFHFNKTAPSSDLLIKKLSQVYQQETYMFSSISTSRRVLSKNERKMTSISLQVFSSVTQGVSGYDLAGSASFEDLEETLKAFQLLDFQVIQLDPLDFNKVAWEEVDGDEWEYEDEVIYFNFTVTDSGKIICLVEQDPDLRNLIYSYMIFTGTCRDYKKCWDFRFENRVVQGNQMWEFNFTARGFNESRYAVSCMVCNLFPGEPFCTDIKNTSVNYIRTDLSFVIYLVASFAWMAF
jgi:hypothetical protein